MDQDTIRAVVEAVKQTPYSIDWTPILWLAGIVVSVIGSLLVWIGYLLKADRNNIVVRTDKHEVWILEQQKELNELGKRTDLSIELIKAEQVHSKERLEQFVKFVEEGKYYVRNKKK